MKNFQSRRTKVFISYCHKDTEWLERLLVHLKPLEREGVIESWNDTMIKPGSKWREEIRNAINSAKVAVLLLSADFLASDFIVKNELPPLLTAANKKGTVILPVLISPSRFEQIKDLSQFQGVNPPSNPLIRMTKADQEELFVKVTKAIEDALDITPLETTVSNGFAAYGNKQGAAAEPLVHDEASIDEMFRRTGQKVILATEEDQKTVQLTVPVELAEGLLFLLVLDQYPAGGWPEGVWGRSQAPVSGFYGHEGDPGSISVSCWAAQALAALFPQENIPEISKFKEYLLSRRKATGAIGMRKSVGSGKARKYEIIENRRHTAMGAKFLKDYGNLLDLSLLSLRYVVDHRTPSGAWSGIGDVADGNADPLTTAYVLRVLRDFESQRLLQEISFKNREQFLKTYWKAGCLWLYQNLIGNGWWLYKTEDEAKSDDSLGHAYCDTGDILVTLPEFPGEDREYASVHSRMIETLEKLWDENGVGIPNGAGTDEPTLEATVYFARTCWLCRDRYPDLAYDLARRFVAGLEALLETGSSYAAGWSMTLTFLNDLQAFVLRPACLPSTRDRARTTWEAMQTGGLDKAVLGMSDRPAWVRQIAKQKILPMQLTPP